MFRRTDPQRPLYGAGASLPAPIRSRLAKTWAGPFQEKVLPLLLHAEERFAPLYFEDNGRPNWSIARRLGICLLQEMLDLTDQDVLDALSFDVRFQHALDLQVDQAYLSRRSLCDFRSRLVRFDPEMKLTRALFDEVAASAIEDLKLSVDVQRLDSTQIASNIRTRGRIDLFTKTLGLFLRELRESAPVRYDALDETLRKWHEAPTNDDDESSRGELIELQQLGEWCVDIVMQFEKVEDVCSWESWELVRRLVTDHCIVTRGGAGDDGDGKDPDDGGNAGPEERVVVSLQAQAITGGAALQSPFDPDATYGHKGVGYSLHIAETTGNGLATEILTDFDLRPAATNDWGQSTPAIDRLSSAGRKPATLLADAGYPHPMSLVEAETRDVEMIAPMSGNGLPEDTIGRDQFESDAEGRMLRCPAGHTPLRHGYRKHANQEHPTLHAYFDGNTCRACPFIGRCVARGEKHSFRVELRRELLLRDRAVTRQRIDPSWKKHYRVRSGIEATNSELKRRHGLRRLRVRRRPRVLLAVTMKLTACNAKRWIRRTKTTRPKPPQRGHLHPS